MCIRDRCQCADTARHAQLDADLFLEDHADQRQNQDNQGKYLLPLGNIVEISHFIEDAVTVGRLLIRKRCV